MFFNKIVPLNELEIDGVDTTEDSNDYTAEDTDDIPEDDDTSTDYTEDNMEDDYDDDDTSTDYTEDDMSEDDYEDEEGNDYTEQQDNEDIDAGDNEDDTATDDEETANSEVGGDGDDGEDSEDSDDQATDYTDDDGDADTDQDTSEDDTTDSDDTGDGSLKSLEKNLFSDLSPEQMSIRNGELLDNFILLYETLNTIFDNINKIPKTYNNANVLNFIAEKVLEQKDLVNSIIIYTFTTRTYAENLASYKQCLLILQQVNTMLKGLVENHKKDDK